MIASNGRRIEVRGTVQGVGFRPWVYRLAQETGVAGAVRNDGSGVLIEAFGSAAALANLIKRLRHEAPPAAEIRDLTVGVLPPAEVQGFAIVHSTPGGTQRVSIPPDLATCPDCLSELFDRADRRFRYPFINCTQCGPRYSIAVALPYDRAATTMAGFTMCPLCQAEYDDPGSRRFHAQPNACPVCGPRLRLVTASGDEVVGVGDPAKPGADPLAAAVRALVSGAILAIKGIGGFHLACDATNGDAVEALRRRKRRAEKPFAVMTRDLAAASRLAWINGEERRLLTAVERPIVLLRRRAATALAPAVAPHNSWLGLFLPYAPLHHLLLADLDRPLVLTSGNRSDEPIAIHDDVARQQLGDLADLFLLHDRPIEHRADDSVARVIAGRPVVLRRGRGYTPHIVTLERPVSRPILACGGQLKNTFCLAVGDSAFLGPHLGDLGTIEASEAFTDAVERLERFVGIRPELIAHDLHPGYWTTSYALGRGDAPTVGVQHHHAHVVSALAEHHLAGPVFGFAFDGTGYGLDGSLWGGELLLADATRCERLATFRPLRLAGGEQAIHQVWRLAFAMLDDAFEGAAPLNRLPLFRGIATSRLTALSRLLASDFPIPLAHGVGRYFDAFGALILCRPEASYEGQVAAEWNGIADRRATGHYPFTVTTRPDATLEVDLRPTVRAVVGELLDGMPVATLAGKFHHTLAAVVGQLADLSAEGLATASSAAAVDGALGAPAPSGAWINRAWINRTGINPLPVILTGGCFQNDLLTSRCVRQLTPRFHVLCHHHIPPGDGGLALGQALIADATWVPGDRSCV